MRIKFTVILLPLLLFFLIPIITAESSQVSITTAQNTVQRIAFVSRRDGNSEVYTINEDGTDLKRLTNSKTDDLMPRWSPDGSKLLYLAKKSGKYELRIMNSDGGDQVKLANECVADYPPLWSPDGSKILFAAKYRSKNAIFTVNIDGSSMVRLTENGSDGISPSWSPDGSKILYLQKVKDDTNIYLINPDGTGRMKLNKESDTYLTAAWSPDGRRIAYIIVKRAFIGAANRINVMNADGSNIFDVATASKRVKDNEFQDDLYWSPDGANIAFTKLAQVDANVSDSGRTTFIFTYGTYFVSADGSTGDNQLAITGLERAQPNWSPDSSKVACVTNSKLMIYTVKSGVDDQIKVNASIPLSPVRWSPDGKKIIFAGKNSSFQKSALYLVTLDGKVIKLSEANDYDPVWAPMGSAK